MAGVGRASGYTTGEQPTPLFDATTMQEQSLSLTVTSEDIRGGMSNALLGRYFHDSLLESTLTDAVFDMQYLALNAGGTIQTNTDSITTESVVVGEGGVITVSNTPVKFGDSLGAVGWVSVEGNDSWELVTFTGQTATTSLTAGTNACVRYNVNNVGMQYFVISSKVIPKIIHLYMTYPLFSVGVGEDVADKTQVGELIVDIPRFQLSGNFDLSLTSSGAATSNLSGQALAKSGVTNCEDMSQYATVKKNIFDSVWYDNLDSMAIDDASFDLEVDGVKTLEVRGIYKDGSTGRISNSLLTFTSDNACATVDNTTNKGRVTGVSAGTAHIEVAPTAIGDRAVPDATAIAEVSVSANA